MTTLEKAKLWLTDIFDEETRNAVETLINSQSPDLEDSFYRELEFGTGGMRGIMGVGTNRLNKYTLGQAKVLDMEDADVFALVGMLGKASAYFPVSYTEEYYEKDSEQNYENEYSENMTYVLNTDKTIKTEYINGSPYSYSYVAIDNDSDNLKVRSLLPSDKKNLNLRSFFIRHHGRK